ncbi:hypothetical protein JCM10213_004124 [Rhodosporidiobolus nylandii]
MPSLLDLPPELLALIMRFTWWRFRDDDLGERNETLLRLMVTCSGLRTLATEVLYEEVSCRRNEPVGWYKEDSTASSWPREDGAESEEGDEMHWRYFERVEGAIEQLGVDRSYQPSTFDDPAYDWHEVGRFVRAAASSGLGGKTRVLELVERPGAESTPPMDLLLWQQLGEACPNVTHVYLQRVCLRNLGPLEQFTRLRRLTLVYVNVYQQTPVAFPELEVLVFVRCMVDRPATTLLSFLGPKLRILFLRGSGYACSTSALDAAVNAFLDAGTAVILDEASLCNRLSARTDKLLLGLRPTAYHPNKIAGTSLSSFDLVENVQHIRLDTEAVARSASWFEYSDWTGFDAFAETLQQGFAPQLKKLYVEPHRFEYGGMHTAFSSLKRTCDARGVEMVYLDEEMDDSRGWVFCEEFLRDVGVVLADG